MLRNGRQIENISANCVEYADRWTVQEPQIIVTFLICRKIENKNPEINHRAFQKII